MIGKKDSGVMTMELDKTALEAAIRVEFEGGNTQAVISAYLAALEKPDTEGWIEWKGGECPVSGETLVDIKLRHLNFYGIKGDEVRWKNYYMGDDIIAYRIHKGA